MLAHVTAKNVGIISATQCISIKTAT